MIPLIALAALWLPQQDTVGVRVQLSQSAARIGEVVVWDVSVTTPGGAPDDIRLPQLPGGLVIEGTRRYDEYTIRLPGGRVRTTRLEVHLRPRRAGRYAIPPVVVVHDGRRYTSRSLTLEVRDSPAGPWQPGAGAQPVEGYDRDAVGPEAEALLRARLEPDTVWVGQQATLVVDALVSNELRSRLRRAPEYLTPSVSGMWTQDLPDATGTRVEWSGPRRYEVQTFRRAYFPLEAGTVEVPPARLIYEARRGFLFTPYTQELETRPLRLVVRPLPSQGAPDSFTGAVGDYSITASVSPAELAVGDAALLTVVVSGRGNLKGAPAPHLPESDDIHLDSPTEDAEIDGAGGVVSGTKTFTWVLVPERSGRLVIGPVSYGFFDPDAGDFRVAMSEPIQLRVTGADTAPEAAAATPATLRPLRARPDPDPFAMLRGWLLLALVGMPLLLVGAALRLRRARLRARIAPSRRALRRQVRQRLTELGAPNAIAESAFFDRLGGTLRNWLAHRLAAPALRTASTPAVVPILERAGVPAALASATRDLLDRIARAPFQPVPMPIPERARLLDRVHETIDRVDRIAPRRPAEQAGAAAVVVALALLATPPVGATQTRGTGDATLSRVAGGYAEGRLDDAAAAARAYLRAHPRDASGWYDLGTVEAARGNRGRATWALLRALSLDPRATDIRHNLDVLGVDEAARRAVTPAVPLRPGEARALALAAWWLALALGAAAMLRRSRRWTMAAATAAAIASIGGAVAFAPRVLPAIAVPLDGAVELQAAPHLHAPVLAEAPEAALLRVVERRDDWLRLRGAGGAEGWLERRDVGIIPGA